MKRFLSGASCLFCVFAVGCFFNMAEASILICGSGSYMSGTGCVACENSYYCRNNNRFPCPYYEMNCGHVGNYAKDCISVIPANDVDSSLLYIWSRSPRGAVQDCSARVYVQTKAGWFVSEPKWNNTSQRYTFTNSLWYKCSEGYYLDGYIGESWEKWYNNCAACASPKPANAHYSSGCAWECDTGHGKTAAGRCEALCSSGVTKLRVGNLEIPLYSAKQTQRAIAIGLGADICWASLEAGSGQSALNLDIGNMVYHTIK